MKNELQELYQQVQEGSTRAMIRIARIYYWGLGVEPDTQKAIEWLRSAVENGRKDANLLLGHVYYDMERTPETDRKAWEAYQAACDVYSGFSFYLGRMLYDNRVSGYEDDRKRLEDAVDMIQDAYAVFDFNVIAGGLYIWKICTELGDYDLAQYYYDGTESKLQDARDYNEWAYGLWELGEYEKALPYIEKCMQLEGAQDDPNILDTYAEILYSVGRKVEAREQFDKCAEIYRQRDERRMLRETQDKIEQKFGK